MEVLHTLEDVKRLVDDLGMNDGLDISRKANYIYSHSRCTRRTVSVYAKKNTSAHLEGFHKIVGKYYVNEIAVSYLVGPHARRGLVVELV